MEAVCVQGGGAGDDHEEANDPGQYGSGDHIHALVPQVLDSELLVDRVRLDEAEPPGSKRCAYGGRDNHDRLGG
jgi:hypothetical protein